MTAKVECRICDSSRSRICRNFRIEHVIDNNSPTVQDSARQCKTVQDRKIAQTLRSLIVAFRSAKEHPSAIARECTFAERKATMSQQSPRSL